MIYLSVLLCLSHAEWKLKREQEMSKRNGNREVTNEKERKAQRVERK